MRTPAEMARTACAVSVVKASLSVRKMLLMGILAGAYIGFAAWFTIAVTFDMPEHLGMGFTKLISGAAFSVGLMMVGIAGSELFTGNSMMPMGYLAGCTPMGKIIRNWGWVYFANFLGGFLVAALVYFAGLVDGPAGGKALSIAAGKMALPVSQAFIRGVLCNWMVTLAVWMMMAATDVTGKIWAAFFPIMAFVASGFEHSVANMHFLSLGMLLRGNPGAVAASGLSEGALSEITLGGYLHNLLPVTLGNIVGGVLFIAVFYYFIYKEDVADLG
ncbi:MAG: formate/nitrite transporter family protein [Synergistaceae bacterium]|nr:formate/nitrite transporter family protein [Synergistaceae bacterium]